MYYPYLRGKQFELTALENVAPAVYLNTLPIVEPVAALTNKVANGIYRRLANANTPLILITNPQNGALTEANVHAHFVNGLLNAHVNLTLGYIVSQRTTAAHLRAFLTANRTHQKAVIFEANFVPALLNAFIQEIRANQPNYLIFESRKTSHITQNAFAHPNRILITDGFQSRARNVDYPADSAFTSDCFTYVAAGWNGIGDYQTVGDNYKEGGGQPYVVTLHLTRDAGGNLIAQHYSSTTRQTLPGEAPLKFTEACDALVTSPLTIPLASSGLTMFRNWHAAVHFPQLGAAKQASIQHHMELLSSLV
jgi:hypothetical protein